MSKHVLNTRRTGAVREEERECVRRHAIVLTSKNSAPPAAVPDHARGRSHEPATARFGNPTFLALIHRF
jgi:hypothetical protein